MPAADRGCLQTALRVPIADARAAARQAFTILELLVAIGVVGLLAAILLPALSAAREAARRVQCVDHLRQIGLALHAYHDQHDSLPAGWQEEATRVSSYGWAVSLLPFLENENLYRQVDRNRPLAHPANTAARHTTIPDLLCPSDISEPGFLLHMDHAHGATSGFSATSPAVELPTASYVGVFGTFEADDEIPCPPGDGTFIGSETIRFADLQRGLSNTLVVGERTMARVPSTWLGVEIFGEDAACRIVGNAWISPNCRQCDECEFDSRHPGGANFLWGDGHVSLLAETISSEEYRVLAQRASF